MAVAILVERIQALRCSCPEGTLSLCLHNAQLLSEEGIRPGGVLIEDGRISALLTGRDKAAAENVIDAKGLVLFPGFIDAHVHMRDPGAARKETFLSGSEAAACGGVTTVMCMPNTSPPVDGVAGFMAAKDAGSGRSYVDFAIQAAATRHNLGSFPALWAEGITSFEGFFLDGPDDSRLDVPDVIELLPQVAELDAVVGLTCGSWSVVERATKSLRSQGRTDFRAFMEARPAIIEALGISQALELMRATNARVVFRQVCTKRGFELLREAKAKFEPGRISVETAPHHLHLDVSVLERMRGFAQMIPPLQENSDREASVAALHEGIADFVASDHAPHTVEEKSAATPWEVPGGTPGLDTIAASVLDLACHGQIPLKRVAECLCEAPARIFGLSARKGFLRPGADGDLVLVDMECERVVSESLIHSKARRSPFEGRPLKGWPVLTILRGRVIAEGGAIVGAPSGQFTARG